MTNKTFRAAINEALSQEMHRNPDVVLMGEDIRGGQGGTAGEVEAWGGVLGATKGLWATFGSSRVIDTPITESAILGLAAGAALTGLRPVAEVMFFDFIGVCLDALYNQIAKFRYMFGGRACTPLVVRGMIGAGMRAAAQHSQSPYHLFTSIPGLKVVVPSSPYDAKGLLVQAIRDDDPVIFASTRGCTTSRVKCPMISTQSRLVRRESYVPQGCYDCGARSDGTSGVGCCGHSRNGADQRRGCRSSNDLAA